MDAGSPEEPVPAEDRPRDSGEGCFDKVREIAGWQYMCRAHWLILAYRARIANLKTSPEMSLPDRETLLFIKSYEQALQLSLMPEETALQARKGQVRKSSVEVDVAHCQSRAIFESQNHRGSERGFNI